MARGEPSKAQLNSGLQYVAQKPAFLANFGKPPPSEREPVPERPSEGDWAGGSDDEDEWEARFGGGDDAPQVVVLKEGRHLNADEAARERRRAKGERSPTPEAVAALRLDKDHAADDKTDKNDSLPVGVSSTAGGPAPGKPGMPPHKAKRKLGEAAVSDVKDESKDKKKKKKKAAKGLLSFNEDEE